MKLLEICFVKLVMDELRKAAMKLLVSNLSEIGSEIAEGLYNAVAVILAYVFRIDSGESLDMPELTLPPELRFDENGNLEQGA